MYKDSLNVIKSILGANQEQMATLMGYRERTSFAKILNGTWRPSAESLKFFVDHGVEPGFLIGSTSEILQECVTMDDFRSSVWAEFEDRKAELYETD